MDARIAGLHHVTAIAGDPQRNIDFYTGVLGLRLVKLTVNYDDPATYHFYYGDGAGRPGSLVTFFPWPGRARGREGNATATLLALAVPHGSLGFWVDRLARLGAEPSSPVERMGEEVLPFRDPDGLSLELVESGGIGPAEGAWEGPVPARHAILGLRGVTLSLERFERTAVLLRETLGFRLTRSDERALRYETGPEGAGGCADVMCRPGGARGHVGVGTIHHVAWRTPDADRQATLREAVSRAGHFASGLIDRRYFRSVYFREPGGVLFELATDGPGFAVDEPPDRLGTSLVLPPAFEPYRARIVRHLPRLRLPEAA